MKAQHGPMVDTQTCRKRTKCRNSSVSAVSTLRPFSVSLFNCTGTGEEETGKNCQK